jgi:hypothetical protein
MTTDDSKFVKIQVKWSNDTTTWVDGASSWVLNPANAIIWSDINQLPVGNGSGSWTLDPKTPGSTNLTVSAGTIVSIPVPVTITPAPPSRATIELAHPTDSIIAGRPFQVLVKIYNTDGLVPGTWCSTSATYTDVLGNGTKTAIPTIVFNGNPIPVPLGAPTGECFSNGLDTIMVVLYNAPVSLDSTHQISLLLNNTITNLTASTDHFHVYPGPLDSLSLEYSNGTPMPGPVTLNYPDEAVNIYARGYDQYGNLIGPIRSNWTKTGSLHDLTPPTTNQVNIYIDASSAVLDENGIVTATAPSGVIAGAFVSDSVQVILVPRKANLSSAPLTKDINGNGFLDQIWLFFDKPIPVSDTANITVRNITPAMSFIVDSLRPMVPGTDSSSTFIIYLRDSVDASNGILEPLNALPETSWRPMVTISGLKGANDVSGQTGQCKDGAGPVIWSVTLTRGTDRTKDVAQVVFSEPIQTSAGNAITMLLSSSSNIPPSLVFSTWKNDGVSLVADTNLLACNTLPSGTFCISLFSKIVDPNNPTTVEFNSLNLRTIFGYDYFSIRMLPGSQVADKATPANLPNLNNQKVKVVVIGVVTPLQVGPNPTKPTYSKPTEGNIVRSSDPAVIDFVNDPFATKFAKGNGGTVFRITISPGDTGQGGQNRVTGYLNIYDVVGNVVNSAHRDGPNDDLMQEIRNFYGTGAKKDTLGFYNYDVYWNGCNAKAMKVAPGVYHAFMYLTTYNKSGTTKSRQQGIVGIGR